MNIEIYYCVVWNYLPEASRVEEEIKKIYSSANIKLNESSGGDFRVLVNETLIFDKLNDTQRFPRENEIVDLIERSF